MPDRERQDTKMATLYELRLIITSDDKTEYTKEELLDLLDNIARDQDQK